MEVFIDWTLWILILLTAALTALPSMRIAHGLVRGGDFPRQQLLILAIVLLPLAWLADLPGFWFAAAMLAAVIATQVFHIGRYLPIWHTQSLRPKPHEIVDEDRTISVLAANVKLSNRQYDRLIALARKREPDVLMALEVDEAWCDALDELSDSYPHRHACPHDNGYGMMVLSRLEIEDATFKERIVDKVPSMSGKVVLPSGERVHLYVVHPEPPVPNHSTEGRDAEMGHVAMEVRELDAPVIVSGDLNDVAWSVTTRRFQKISRLLDPRVGRGFYNSFSAQTRLMRWPLDHLFHSPHFRILDMQREEPIGSDHFPMYFKLLLTPQKDAEEMPEKADADDEKEVRVMIEREKSEKREAIGSDWEDED